MGTSSPPPSHLHHLPLIHHSSPIYGHFSALFSSPVGDDVKCFDSSAALLRLRVNVSGWRMEGDWSLSLSLPIGTSPPSRPSSFLFLPPFFYFAICENFL